MQYERFFTLISVLLFNWTMLNVNHTQLCIGRGVTWLLHHRSNVQFEAGQCFTRSQELALHHLQSVFLFLCQSGVYSDFLTVNEIILSNSITGAMWQSNTKYYNNQIIIRGLFFHLFLFLCCNVRIRNHYFRFLYFMKTKQKNINYL